MERIDLQPDIRLEIKCEQFLYSIVLRRIVDIYPKEKIPFARQSHIIYVFVLRRYLNRQPIVFKNEKQWESDHYSE